MQENALLSPSFLTTAEAAAYLRLKERKLYDLVAAGTIPCTKVTGRWLFPKAELDRWVLAGLSSLPAPDAPPIVGGSHDPLLEWALQESGSGLAVLAVGSEGGLERLVGGEVIAASMHLHATDGAPTDANVAAIQARPALADTVLIAFARREQGLLVPPGNPAGLRDIADVARSQASMARRQQGAGAAQLLAGLAARAGLPAGAVRFRGPVCATGAELAQQVRSGAADCGVATRAVADAHGVDFVPLAWEHFDLAMRRRAYFGAPMQKVTAMMRSARFRARARELGGYDTAASGTVRFVP